MPYFKIKKDIYYGIVEKDHLYLYDPIFLTHFLIYLGKNAKKIVDRENLKLKNGSTPIGGLCEFFTKEGKTIIRISSISTEDLGLISHEINHAVRRSLKDADIDIDDDNDEIEAYYTGFLTNEIKHYIESEKL